MSLSNLPPELQCMIMSNLMTSYANEIDLSIFRASRVNHQLRAAALNTFFNGDSCIRTTTATELMRRLRNIERMQMKLKQYADREGNRKRSNWDLQRLLKHRRSA